MKNFIKKFVEEATEIISTLEDEILRLEESPEDKEIIENIFRAMHTLKGGGAMFGFEKVRDITHELEEYYDHVRSGKMPVMKDILDLTLESIDLLKEIISEGTEDDIDIQNIDKHIEKINSHIEKSLERVVSYEVNTNDEHPDEKIKTYQIFFKPNKDLLKNGTDPMLLISELTDLGEYTVFAFTTNVPALDKLEPDCSYLSWNIILATDKPNEISDVFIFVEDEAQIDIKEIEEGNAFENIDFMNNIEKIFEGNSEKLYELEQVEADILEEDEIQYGEKEQIRSISVQEVDDDEHEDISGNIIELEEESVIEIQNINDELKYKKNDNEDFNTEETNSRNLTKKKKNSISSIRISSDKVDILMNLVSELITTQARLNLFAENQNNPELYAITENIQKLSRQLRDNAFDLSIIPLQTIVVRFHRLIRDLSSELKKDIEFVTEGTSTELDKSIIENLTDPLLHILRNSIDHGIESPETRRELGKPEKGTISLNAFYSGANVHIQISDDGKGIDVERIRAKALKKGLISSTKNYSKKELLDLIFVPGFSTSDKVTDISGRGVGMDVVKRKITQIRGALEVDSTPGVGTHIIIKLPLTLSIIDGLLIQIDSTKYIIPLSVVNKIYPIKHNELAESFYNIIVLDGKQVPYYYLREEFGCDQNIPKYEQVIVVGYDNTQTGIVVDKVIGEYQAVLKPLGKHYNKLQIFSGATILGDGTVALVMDTNQIINKFSNQLSDNKLKMEV